MKKVNTVFLFLIITTLFSYNAIAQTISGTTYPFSNSSGAALEPMTTGTTQLIGSNLDNVASAVSSIGFDFWFDGVRYTQFSVNENGLLKLGSTVVTNESVNAMASATNLPKIAPYWDDLATGTTGNVIYKVTGTAPNRKLIVQWFVTLPKVTTNPANATFQVWLYETTGMIEFVYGSGLVTNSANYSVGIGNSSSVFASVNTAFPFTNYGVATDNNTSALTSGSKYTFTPQVPLAPTSLTFSGVTIQAMTLNWTNNATNAVGNVIYNSLDGINYSFVTQVASSATSASFTGLLSGTLYYWQVFAVTEGGMSTVLSGTQSTNVSTLSGIKTIGPSAADYPSITAAIAAVQTNGLSGALVLELQSAYVSSVETFPVSFSGLITSAVNTITLRPAAGATGLSITSAATSTINLDGVSYVIIDGRPGGTGTLADLNIGNTLASSSATILIQNDASHNLVEYCNISGVSTAAAAGVVEFGTTTGTTGSNYNTIDNCNLFDGGTAGVSNGIYATGTAGKENKFNVISNNNIYNFFSSTISYYGIQILAGNTDWTISGNSFYQTTARSSAILATAISIGAGTNYVINGNFIGGTAPNAGGIPWSLTGGSTSGGFVGINLNTAAATAVFSVTNNTVANLNIIYTAANYPLFSGPFVGILFNNGSNFTATGNTIGSSAVANSITVNSAAMSGNGYYGGTSYGIYMYNTQYLVSATISNNTVGGINVTASTTTKLHSFVGINSASLYATPTITINNNLVGSATVANSIISSTASTLSNGLGNVVVIGIQNGASCTVNITNNTIANLNNYYSGATASMTRGIYSTAGTNTITGNTVYNLNGLTSAVAVSGIVFSSTAVLPRTISQNVVYALQNDAATGAASVVGISFSGAASTNLVARNFVHSLNLLTNTTTSTIVGIQSAGGTSTYQNNIVRLGIKADGTPITTGYSIYGIYESGGTDKFYFNSVYIGGTGVTAGSNTFAFYRTNTTTCDTRDNVFFNARSNTAATTTNYTIQITAITGLTLNYNVYYTTGTGASFGLIGATNYATYGAWKAAVATDINSGFSDPNFVLPTGSSATLDMHVQSPTAVEGIGIDIPTVTDDYFGNVRSLLTPVDIGACAGNFTGVDVLPPVIAYTVFSNTASTANRILTATIADASGVPTIGTLQPRIYFKKGPAGTWYSTQGVLSLGTGTSGTWSFTVDNTLLGGVVVSDVVYYYVIAQDIAAVPNISSLPAGVTASDVNTITTPPATLNSYTIMNGLSGVITVGSGGTYASLTLTGGLFDAINTSILSGNLTANIISDLTTETGAVTLTKIINDGTGNYTVTINPVGVRTVSGASVSPALININGASGLIIDGLNTGGNTLTISNTSTSYPTLLFTAGASNNIVTNTTLKGVALSGAVVSFGAQSATSGCNNNNINNCSITSGATSPAYGIYMNGTGNPMGSNNVFNNNIITNFTNTGIYCFYYYANYTVSNNEIYNAVPSGTSLNGILVSNYYGCGTVNIFNNKIHDLNPALTTSTGTINGLYYQQGATADVLNIYNNLIYLDVAVNNTQATLYGLNLDGNGSINTYYNTIYIAGSGITAGSSAGLAKIGSYQGTTRFMNNIIFNARSGGTGIHYGINESSSWGTLISNYNDIYTTGSGSVFGNYRGTSYLTLSSWTSGSTQDLNSFSGNPGFTSATMPVNFMPNVNDPNTYILNGNGMPIATIAVDYIGTARSTAVNLGPSDIGAYEFTPAPSVIPNSATQMGTIQVGNTTAYFIANRLIASITWTGGTSLPTAVTLKYWSGVTPPAITGTQNGNGYWDITQTGGTNFTYNITLYYSPAAINTITSEANITVSKGDAGVWSAFLSAVVNTTTKTVSLNGLNSFSYFALSDRGLIVPIDANLKVFLQGPFVTNAMTTLLNSGGLLPLTSETAYPAATYGYTARNVVSIPNANIVDWVLVELRTGTAATTKVTAQAGFIKNDGTIVDLDGVSPLTFGIANSGSYYVVIRHRNHLAIMSAAPVALSAASTLYDFTTAQAKAYGVSPMVDLTGTSTIFGMAGGNNDGNNLISTNDYNNIGLNLFSAGYLTSDHNMNGNIFVDDYNLTGANLFMATQVP